MHTKKWHFNKGSYKAMCKEGYALEYEVENLNKEYIDGNPTRIKPKLVKIEQEQL